MSKKLWATPRSYSFNQSHTPGLTTLDCQVRGLYPEKERYHGVSTDSNQLTLFAEAFPVSRTPSLAAVPDRQMSATCGRSSLDSFASLDPDGSWRKTCQGYSQVTLDGSLERFSETWPRAGMTRNGTAYRRPPLVPLTDEIASGSWPTPRNCTAMAAAFTENTARAKFPNLETVVARRMWPTATSRDHKDGSAESCKNVPPNGLLGRVVHQWPTPTQADGMVGGSSGRSGGENLRTAVNGALNPTWVEWLMGYPLGWTVCEGWETRSSRRLPSGSPKGSSKLRRKVDDSSLHRL